MTVPTISIITAVVAGKHNFLRETYDSLIKQKLPTGWDWQWIVQEDGETGIPLKDLPDDDRISSGMGSAGRAPMARTMGLDRADGLLVRALDADDLLPDGALYRDITALTQHSDIAWCVSPAVDLLPDGHLRPGPRDPSPGPLPPQFFADGERSGLLQVVGTTMCTYLDLVHALGGWQALPAEEDVALLLAVEAVSKGLMLREPGLYYRRWEGNSTAETDKRHASAGTPRRRVLLQRADSLRSMGWQWNIPERKLSPGAATPGL